MEYTCQHCYDSGCIISAEMPLGEDNVIEECTECKVSKELKTADQFAKAKELYLERCPDRSE